MGEPVPRCENRSRKLAGEPPRSDASQAQIQGFELAHPNIYPIDELLEGVKGPVPQIQNYKISMTQGNDRIAEMSPSEDPEAGDFEPDQQLIVTNICKQRSVDKRNTLQLPQQDCVFSVGGETAKVGVGMKGVG
jgi:hypothetical protein